ncbi:HNH endonuclease [Massilia oculi]|uniref:HNH endonuclease n=1 Tax=Massilia oculi TaxID=945844 RepID=A0A2S2DFW5_9BURK|nr:HNH endonuclease [Massilia oculi]
MKMPTAERVRELFDYDPDTGIFIRKITIFNGKKAGTRADVMRRDGRLAGYTRICVDCGRYLAHRIAWLYMTGSWPSDHIDHINGDPSDNRFCNLRDVPSLLNQQNQRKPRPGTCSGYLGVSRYVGKRGVRWYANITAEKKSYFLGSFDTPEAAHEAYVSAKRRLHRGCTI